MEERTCDEYSAVIRRAAGWVFGDLFHYYFGNGSIVLVGEGPNGEDLSFAATDEWLKANHVSSFGISSEDAADFSKHVEKCSSPQCQEAKGRLSTLSPFFSEGKLPGSPAIVLLSVFESKNYNAVCKFSRDKGAEKIIDEIKPFLQWFTQDKEFWKWPNSRP